MTDPTPAAAETAIQQIPFKLIRPSELNPRKNFDHPDAIEALESLAASIEAQGLLENLVARPAAPAKGKKKSGGFELIAGERRWRAFRLLVEQGKRAAEDTLPVKVHPCNDDELLELALIENLQRANLHPLDEAEAYQALVKAGRSTAEIAETVKLTPRHVQLRLQLADNLVPKLKAAFREGELKLAQARMVAAYAPGERQGKVLEEITADNYWYQTADDLKDMLIGELPAVKQAAFDLELYDGPLNVDPDDPEERYFADVEQFTRLQEAEVTRLKHELGETYAWVEVVRGYFRKFDYGKSTDLTKAGAVIEVNSDLKVTVHTDLLRPGAPSAKGAATAGETKAAPDPDDPRRQVPTAAGLDIAHRAKTRALQRALLDHGPDPIMIALIVCLAGDSRVSELNLRPDYANSKIVDDQVEKALAWLNKICHGSPGEAFEAVGALESRQLHEAFAAIVAQHLVCKRWGTGLGDEDLPLALARALQPDPREVYRLDGAYLDACRRPALVQIALDLQVTGAALGEIDDTAIERQRLEKLKVSDLKAAILEHIEADPDEAAAYLPFPFRYGTEEELLEAAKPAAAEAPATVGGTLKLTGPQRLALEAASADWSEPPPSVRKATLDALAGKGLVETELGQVRGKDGPHLVWRRTPEPAAKAA